MELTIKKLKISFQYFKLFYAYSDKIIMGRECESMKKYVLFYFLISQVKVQNLLNLLTEVIPQAHKNTRPSHAPV